MFGGGPFGGVWFGEGAAVLVPIISIPGFALGYAILHAAVEGYAVAANEAEGSAESATAAEGRSIAAVESDGVALPTYAATGYAERSGA